MHNMHLANDNAERAFVCFYQDGADTSDWIEGPFEDTDAALGWMLECYAARDPSQPWPYSEIVVESELT